jgi:hypothetical protein
VFRFLTESYLESLDEDEDDSEDEEDEDDSEECSDSDQATEITNTDREDSSAHERLMPSARYPAHLNGQTIHFNVPPPPPTRLSSKSGYHHPPQAPTPVAASSLPSAPGGPTTASSVQKIEYPLKSAILPSGLAINPDTGSLSE